MFDFFLFRYMKGRLTYDQINKGIDEFNKAVTEKYKILATPRNKQSMAIKTKIRTFKEQDTNDTRGENNIFLCLNYQVISFFWFFLWQIDFKYGVNLYISVSLSYF